MPDLPPEQYYPSLPTKRMGAGVVFTNDDDQVLLVKPTYKVGWEIPGGTVEADEGPYAAAQREIAEELGMTRTLGALLVVDWVPQRGLRTEALMFVFDGGRLTGADIASIALPATELHSFAFCDPDEAVQRLSPLLARRVTAALDARSHGTACLHNGYSVYTTDDDPA